MVECLPSMCKLLGSVPSAQGWGGYWSGRRQESAFKTVYVCVCVGTTSSFCRSNARYYLAPTLGPALPSPQGVSLPMEGTPESQAVVSR